MRKIIGISIVLLMSISCNNNKGVYISEDPNDLKRLISRKYTGLFILENDTISRQHIYLEEGVEKLFVFFNDTSSRIYTYSSDSIVNEYELYKNGKMKSYYQYVDKKPIGDAVQWYDNGRVRYLKNFSNKEDHGYLNTSLGFHNDGSTSSISNFFITKLIKHSINDSLRLSIYPVGNLMRNSSFRVIVAADDTPGIIDTILFEGEIGYLNVDKYDNDNILEYYIEEYVRTDTIIDGKIHQDEKIKSTYMKNVLK